MSFYSFTPHSKGQLFKILCNPLVNEYVYNIGIVLFCTGPFKTVTQESLMNSEDLIDAKEAKINSVIKRDFFGGLNKVNNMMVLERVVMLGECRCS